MAASSRQQCPMSCVRLRLLSQILRCGKGLFFLAAASEQKEAEKQYEFLEHIRRALFKLRGADMADGGHVGHRCLLIYLAIVKKMEPSLLLPMGFGAILVNLPASGAITQGDTVGPISALFEAGMSNELFPLLLFIGIGAMIDFGPLLEKPWLMLFGAAAQFGIFFTLFLAGFFFDLKDAASIAVIGAADGPTAIFVANTLKSQYLALLWWRLTATWRWCPSCSRRSSVC